jgi:asparagine synthase (glutamine-hydrolysing)
MVSDAPVGLLLSGGLDSSSVACSLYRQDYKDIDTFTVRFRESAINESSLASDLSASYQFRSHNLLVEGKDLFDKLVTAAWSHDEPMIHSNDPHMVAISEFSKQYVKVLLSGEGADELMGGYVRHRTIKHWTFYKTVSLALSLPVAKRYARAQKLKRYINACRNIEDAILLNASNLYPADFGRANHLPAYRENIVKEARAFLGNDPVKAMLYLDQHTYMVSLLDRNDRSTMAAGIECREPFLDYELVEGLASLPSKYFVRGKKGKDILFNSVGRHLPEQIRQFRKIGFEVPWDRYFREDPMFREVICSIPQSDVLNKGMFRIFDKKQIIDSYLAGNDAQRALVRQLFLIKIWEDTYLKKFN